MLKNTIALACTTAILAFSANSQAGHDDKKHATPWENATLEAKIKALPQGSVERGQVLNTQMMCNACHGETGQSPSRNYASLNAQPFEYTAKLMLDYQDERRWENYKQANIMVKIAQAMTEQEIADMAAFYAAQKPTTWSWETKTSSKATERLVRKGDASRMITPCASCHGAKGEGKDITPALAGQVPEYFMRTMQAYKQQARHNDVQQGMAQFAKDLTDQEIADLAIYYANLGKGE
jgi:cytochrome c553